MNCYRYYFLGKIGGSSRSSKAVFGSLNLQKKVEKSAFQGQKGPKNANSIIYFF